MVMVLVVIKGIIVKAKSLHMLSITSMLMVKELMRAISLGWEWTSMKAKKK